jgi:photosystem II stability/assembly factor-like uncharacterized protein
MVRQLRRAARPGALIVVLVVTCTGLQGMATADPLTPAGRWITHGPPGSQVNAVAVDPRDHETVYAGTQVGVYVSHDGANRWEPAGVGIPAGSEVKEIEVSPSDPSQVFVGVDNAVGRPPGGLGGIYRSTDQGVRWTRLTVPLGYLPIGAFAVDPTDPATVYAGDTDSYNWGGPLYRTTDAGATWTALSTPGLTTVVSAAVDPFDSRRILAGSPGGGAWVSSDGGGSFHESTGLPPNPAVKELVFDPSTPLVVYAGTEFIAGSPPGLFRSTDGGESFIRLPMPVSSGEGVLSIAIDPTDAGRMFVGTDFEGVFRTSDGGATWTAVNTGLPVRYPYGSQVFDLAMDPVQPDTLYLGDLLDFGAFKTATGGDSWFHVINGLGTACIGTVAVEPSDPMTAYAGGGTGTSLGFFGSDDGGSHWWRSTSFPGGVPASITSIAPDPIHPGVLYVGAGGGPFVSSNGGHTWRSILGDLPFSGSVVAVDPTDPNTIWAAGGTYVEVTHDRGTAWSWTDLTDGNVYFDALAIDPADPGVVLAAAYDLNGQLPPQIYRTSDGGTTWTSVLTAASSYQVSSIAFDPLNSDTVYATRVRLFPDHSSVLISSDAGNTWRTLSRTPGEAPAKVLPDPVREGILYLSEGPGSAHRSIDGGRTWQPFRKGITSTAVVALATAADGSRIYAGGCDSTLLEVAGAVYERELG